VLPKTLGQQCSDLFHRLSEIFNETSKHPIRYRAVLSRIITAGFATGAMSTWLALGFVSPATSDGLNCESFAWPNYPPGCLITTDGEAVREPVRTAAANAPDANLPERLSPLPAINMIPRQETEEPRRNYQLKDRYSQPHTVTVWRGGNPDTDQRRNGSSCMAPRARPIRVSANAPSQPIDPAGAL
jgi:hypothetical protein